MSEKRRLISKIVTGALAAGFVMQASGCVTETPKDNDNEQDEYLNDFLHASDFLTNDSINPDAVSLDYFRQAGYIGTDSDYSDSDYENRAMKIQIKSNVPSQYRAGLEDSIEYYNELFELANMNTRLELEIVEEFDGTADIAFKLSRTLKLEKGFLGEAKYDDPDSMVGTITVDSVHFNDLEEDVPFFDYYKRILNHELLHVFGVGHESMNVNSLMASSIPNDVMFYYKLTPADLKSFFRIQGNIMHSEELMQNAYNYIEQENINFLTVLADAQSSGLSHNITLNENSVTYFYFHLGEKSSRYEGVYINLNDVYKGEYQATYIMKNGDEYEFSGKAYIIDNDGDQQIWLDSFVFNSSRSQAIIYKGISTYKSDEINAVSLGILNGSQINDFDDILGNIYSSENERGVDVSMKDVDRSDESQEDDLTP
jgi:hypothetical protein